MDIVCNVCKIEKNMIEYNKREINNKKYICKVCHFLKRKEKDIKYKNNWTKQEYITVLDNILNKKIKYLNQFCEILDKDFDDILDVIRNFLNIRDKPVNIKVKCAFCKEKEIIVTLSKYMTNKNTFCCRKHYWEFKKLPEQKGENFYTYKRIKSKCDFCKKEITISDWDTKNRKNNFCSPNCYWEFRKIYYVGENHNAYGMKRTEVQRNKMREITINRYVNGEFGSKKYRNTKIQIKIDDLLEGMNIKFEKEKIFKYYAVDNYLLEQNLIIENMGDFFHSSPYKYNSEKNLHKMQKKNIRKDKAKKTYIYKYYNIKSLYLWEYDINNNITLCEKLIELYIENKGLLKDYNSFNYELINNCLTLKKEIKNPYFY